MRLTVLSGLMITSAACMTPRSFTFQQMAAPAGRGVTEAGVFAGAGYALQTNPPVTTGSGASAVVTQTQTRGLIAPGVEANVQHGFTEHVGLNLHASAAGIQPGLKFTLNKSKVAHFAISPAFAIGYGSVASTTYQSTAAGGVSEVNPGTTTSFSFLAGLKLLFSHRSGFYVGAGYDLLLHRLVTSTAPNTMADRTDVLSVTLAHQISAGIGFDVALGNGRVHLRPEVSAAVYPAISQSAYRQAGSTAGDSFSSGGFGWAILPGAGLYVVSDVRKVEAEEDEDEVKMNDAEDEGAAEKRKKQRHQVKEDEDDDE